MMSEDSAARIVHRLVSPQSSWGQFERTLVNQQRPGWNQAVGLVADAIREAVQEVKQCPSYTRCTAPGADAEWATPSARKSPTRSTKPWWRSCGPAPSGSIRPGWPCATPWTARCTGGRTTQRWRSRTTSG